MGYEFFINGNASFSVISLGVVLTEDINSCCGIRRKSMKRKIRWKAFDKSGRAGIKKAPVAHGYLGLPSDPVGPLPAPCELFPLNWNDKKLLL